MKCSSCEHDNREGARYCEACGSKLEKACGKCGEALSETARFCPSCGTAIDEQERIEPERDIAEYTPRHLAEKILQSRSALEGERKQVTILFADVKGSMGIAGQLDPEDWHQLLDEFFAILSTGVHQFEGTVNQYTGDGIMAIFGAPIAHEDHAQRACYAALQLQEGLRRFSVDLRVERGIDFSTRIGINSGEVVVGKIGDDLRMDYTAQGHVVGIAQRLESIAEPGHAYVSEHTARLVRGFFELHDLGATQLAGNEDSLGVFDLERKTGARTRMDISRARGLTQFVGRVDELRSLEGALVRARDGYGQVVGVVGEPGLGKSRLCLEFVEKCRAQELPVYEARCPSYGKTIPFIPILELFRSYFGISDQDTADQARQKIAGALMLLDPTMHTGLPILFEFLGVGDPHHPAETNDPDARQRQLFELLHRISRVQNERGVASVIFIDDLHWIDTWSDEFVAQMVEATQASHTLLLVNFRPEYQAAWTSKPHYQQLPLVPLGASDVREMLTGLLGEDDSVVILTDKIMQWTGGNPLYSEEVINTLIETEQLVGSRGAYQLSRNVESLEVPPTVHAIIAARIDRLDDDGKQILHGAAVIGKEFSRPLIERVVGLDGARLSVAIENLKTFDFIYETALYPSIEYSFKHPLVHEVAYEAQLKEPRAKRHKLVAEALEDIESDRLDEFASMIAYHWDRANDDLIAMRWHRRAAHIAGASEPRIAHQHWLRLRELVEDVEQSDEVLAMGAESCGHINTLAWRLGGGEEMSTVYFEDGRAMAERAGDKKLLSMILGSYAIFRGVTLGYANDYSNFGTQAVTVAVETGDAELENAMRLFRLWGLIFSGQFPESIKFAESFIDRLPMNDRLGIQYSGLPSTFGVFLGLGLAHASVGNFDLGIEHHQQSERFANASPDFRCIGDGGKSFIHSVYGEHDEGLRIGREAAARANDGVSSYIRAAATSFFGVAQYHAGELSAARETLEDTLKDMNDHKTGGCQRSIASGGLAQVEVALGEYEKAKERAEACIAFCRPRDLYVTPTPWLALAEANIGLNDLEGALLALRDARSVIDKTGAQLYQPFLHEIHARFGKMFRTGWDWDEEMDIAQRLFREIGATNQAKRVADFSA